VGLFLPRSLIQVSSFFVPSVGAYAVNDTDDNLLGFIVETGHETVIHNISIGEEEGIIPNACSEQFHCVLADKNWFLKDDVNEILVEQDFIPLSGTLDLAVPHGAFQIKSPIWRSLVEQILHNEHEPIEFESGSRAADRDLE